MSNLEMVGTEIETRINSLQEELKKQTSYLNDINSAIKKLRHDAIATQANIDKIVGAVQAYSEALRLSKTDNKTEIAKPKVNKEGK